MTGFDSAAALALLLIRPGVIILATPFLGAVQAPPVMRIGLTVLVAIVLAPFVALPATLSVGALALVVLRELTIGVAIALAVRVLIAGAEFAGHFAAYQIGLSAGSLIDPKDGVRNNLLALLYSNAAVVICLISNAHHLVFRALADSYRGLPVGLGGVDGSLAATVARMLGQIFTIGVRIAAPVVVVLLLVEVTLGLLARVAPALNVMTAGAPIRVIVGLLIVGVSVTALPPVVSHYLPVVLDLSTAMAGAFR